MGDEVDVIRSHHGDDAVVWDDEEDEWRTRVEGDKCIFLKDGLCSIHAAPYYPKICRGFPYTDGETGGPYLYDQTICPDFE